MLTLKLEGEELFDEETETFQPIELTVLEFEHSLASLSKWESQYKRPFLGTDDKTEDETLAYILHMLVTPIEDHSILFRLSPEHMGALNDYINSTESATTFTDLSKQGKTTGEVITSELIYYWLVAFNIPFEVESWHLNRLFSLVRICNIKNTPPKKMSRTEAAQRNRDLNAERRAATGSSG